VLGGSYACSSMDSNSAMDSASPGGENRMGTGGYGKAGDVPTMSAGGSSSISAGGAALPPENETSADFELPHAGEHFVYAAGSSNDAVAVIDATTLKVQTIEAGDGPRYLQTLAGKDAAIVLNVGSSDATIVRTDEKGVSKATKVDVVAGSNAIAVAPDGAHAV